MTTTPPTDAQPGVRSYRRRPVDVEAMQVTEGNVEDVAAWMRAFDDRDIYAWDEGQARLTWGAYWAGVGDWVVRESGYAVSMRPRDFQAEFDADPA